MANPKTGDKPPKCSLLKENGNIYGLIWNRWCTKPGNGIASSVHTFKCPEETVWHVLSDLEWHIYMWDKEEINDAVEKITGLLKELGVFSSKTRKGMSILADFYLSPVDKTVDTKRSNAIRKLNSLISKWGKNVLTNNTPYEGKYNYLRDQELYFVYDQTGQLSFLQKIGFDSISE